MLVLSAMQPPKLSSAAAAASGGSGSSSGNVAAGAAAAEAATSAPATRLELDGLAVQRKKGTLRVVMLEAKSSRASETSCVQQCIVHNVCPPHSSYLAIPCSCIANRHTTTCRCCLVVDVAKHTYGIPDLNSSG